MGMSLLAASCSQPKDMTLREGSGWTSRRTYTDFVLTGQARTEEGAAAAVRFCEGAPGTGYEVLLQNGPIDGTLRTGSLTHVRNLYRSLAKDGEWFDFSIAVRGNNIGVQIDGVDGRLIKQREVSMKTLVISGYAPQVDTSFVILTDTTGKFSIDPLLMYHTPGNIYLNDLLEDKYKAKFYVENMFDTINEYRQDLPHYFVDNHLNQTNNSERIKLDENVILIKEVVVTDKRGVIYRDKETGYLDSLAVLKSGEWVCDCDTIMPFLNDYKGYSHHPKDSPMEAYYGKRRIPKRGEKYQLIEIKETCVQPDNFGEVPIFATPYQADPTKSLRARHAKGPEFIIWAPVDEPRRGFVYPGPQYTEKELLEQSGIAKVQGYYPKREFYQPDTLDLQSPMPDPRNLLQWQPEVITDNNGTAEIPFAASDINTEFIDIVEAIDGNGLMGYQTFTFRVLKKGK